MMDRSLPLTDPVVRAALGWLGTPFRHRASCRGAGADCLGLVRGVWREVIGPEPEGLPGYTPDWVATGAGAALAAGLCRHLLPSEGEMGPGEVLAFRLMPGAGVQHLAILADSGAFVHAYSGRGVVLTPLDGHWRRRLLMRFRFPPRSD